MKKIIIMVLLMISLSLIGCKKTNTDMKDITNLVQNEIFTQTEERYYVFFYRDDCADCERAKPYVIDYIDKVKQDATLIPIYGVNLSNPKNSSMYKAYSGSNGQGTGDVCSNKLKVDNVTQYDELYIGCTASLIMIYTLDGVKTARFRANGRDNIRSELGL